MDRKNKFLTNHILTISFGDSLKMHPIISTKEYKNFKEYYLFNRFKLFTIKDCGILQNFRSALNWWFSVNFIDNHIVIKFFGFKICKKHKCSYHLPEISISNTTKVKRDTKLIVSLTTFPARINTVYKTISSLLNQTLKPDELILWLAEEQFLNKKLPENLTKLEQYGLKIMWYEKDIKSFKKLIPTLQKYPNDIIVTFDDDYYYDERILEYLYNAYLENPNCIHARQAFIVKGEIVKSLHPRSYVYDSSYLPSYRNEPVGCGGVLYPPHSLHENVLNENEFLKELPTHDDIWFWGHALRNNTKISVLKKGYDLKNYIIEGSQADSLWQKNKNKSTLLGGMTGKQAINKICELFPDVQDKL